MDEDTRTNGECNEFKSKKIQQSNRDRLKGEDEEDRWKINTAPPRVRRTRSHEPRGQGYTERQGGDTRLHGDTRTRRGMRGHGTEDASVSIKSRDTTIKYTTIK